MQPCSPSPDGKRVEISLAPNLSSLTALAGIIQEFGAANALSHTVRNRLNLMLDELITNSITYGLPKISEPELRLRLHVDEGAVVAQLEDNGAAFNPFEEAPEPDPTLGLEERPIGGLGVFLVKQLANSTAYERVDGRNRITLRHLTGGES
jgi:anti-sigma regulatory factor (Ser/Thr protein kinase)